MPVLKNMLPSPGALLCGIVTMVVSFNMVWAGLVPAAHAQEETPPRISGSEISILPPAPGLIFDVQAREYIMFDELVRRLEQTRYVLIGEKHDNPIHHHHQAQLIDALTRADKRQRAVVWEMFTRDQQPLLDQNWQTLPVGELGAAMTWEERGWPSWHDYAPIAEAAKANDLPMIAGNLPDDILRPMVSDGLSALPDDLADQLQLPDMPDNIATLFDREIAEGHCDKLPVSMLPAFSRVQFARDASLARAMHDAAEQAGNDGAFLIAGAMHVRRNIAAPWHLERFDGTLTDRDIAVISLIETDDPTDDPAGVDDYAARLGAPDAVDFMWFTNDILRDNPCDGLTMGQ